MPLDDAGASWVFEQSCINQEYISCFLYQSIVREVVVVVAGVVLCTVNM